MYFFTRQDQELLCHGLGRNWIGLETQNILTSYPLDAVHIVRNFEDGLLIHIRVALIPNSEARIVSRGLSELPLPFGHLFCAVTHPSYRGRGLATSSLRLALNWFRSNELKQCYSAIWAKYDGSSQSEGYIRRAGGTLLQEVPCFWTKVCDSTDAYCPEKGRFPTCKCILRIYGVTL